MPKKKLDNMNWKQLCEEVAGKIRKADDKEFKKFFMEREKLGYLFDYFAVLQAYLIYKRLRKDSDSWSCFTGLEGEGKSTFAIQFCSWVDPTFDKDRIHFDVKGFIKALQDAQPYQAFLLDEAGAVAFSRAAMSLDNQIIVRIAMSVRAKNLFIALCIPNIHYLDNYLRYHRVRHLFYLTERGKYKGIVDRGIMTVLIDGARYKNISGLKIHPEYTWNGYFTKSFPSTINIEEYMKKKMTYVNLFLKNLKVEDIHDIKKFVPVHIAAKEIGVLPQNLTSMIKKGEYEGKKIGGLWFLTTNSYKKLMEV
jgi:hypothetical protein